MKQFIAFYFCSVACFAAVTKAKRASAYPYKQTSEEFEFPDFRNNVSETFGEQKLGSTIQVNLM